MPFFSALLRLWPFTPVISFASFGTPAPIPPEEYIRHLPATNPYRPILERLLSASSEDQSALGNTFGSAPNTIPSAPLTPAQQQLARELTEALVRAATAPATTSADWPLQISPDAPDNLYAGNLPEIAPLKLLASIATHHADALPAAQAIPIYAAVGQLARQQRQGIFLIQQLNGVRIEDEALAAASRRLASLDSDSLAALARSWSQLQPFLDPRRPLENERDVGFTFLVEAVLRPALIELLGASA
ncbi:MAG: hypothetical protein RIQ79_2312, partial [Verrucomicrobiota bacterium]